MEPALLLKKNPPLIKRGIRHQRTVNGGRFFRGSVSWGSPCIVTAASAEMPFEEKAGETDVGPHIFITFRNDLCTCRFFRSFERDSNVLYRSRRGQGTNAGCPGSGVLSHITEREAEVTSDISGLCKQGLLRTEANADLKCVNASTVRHVPLIRVSVYWIFIWARPHI